MTTGVGAPWRCGAGAAIVLVVAACGDGSIDPSDVTAADLYGHWGQPLGTPLAERVLDFREDGTYHPALAGGPTLLAYQVDPGGVSSHGAITLGFIMGFTVADGALSYATHWTGDGGTLAPPGMAVSTIRSFDDDGLVLVDRLGNVTQYVRKDRCETPISTEGLHMWLPRTFDQLETSDASGMGAATAPDGAILTTLANRVYRYDGGCVPEPLLEPAAGTWLLEEGRAGVHAIQRTEPMATYRLLPPGSLVASARTLPIAGAEVVDAADVDGRVAILARTGTSYAIVRDTGAGFTTTPIEAPGLLQRFHATALADRGGSRLAIVGAGDHPSGNGRAIQLVSEGAGGMTTELLPTEDGGAEMDLVFVGDDVTIVYSAGGIGPGGVLGDLHLLRRRGGVWADEPLMFGSGTTLTARDGVVWLAAAVRASALTMFPTYTRIDGDVITQWTADRRGMTWSGAPRPGIAVDANGTVYVATRELAFRRFDEAAATEEVTFQLSGTGRIYSTDGLVDCRATCTVRGPIGQRLLLRTEPASGLITGSWLRGRGDVELGPASPGDPTPTSQVVTVTF